MTSKPQTILVTGAAGLIGSAVSRQLLDLGHQVIAFDNFSIGDWNEERAGLLYKKGDIAEANFDSLFKDTKIEAVVHCAAHPGGRSLQEPSLDVEVNAFGSMRLFEWCARQQVKVVYLSSSIVYGEQPCEPISETAPVKPGTVYGVCKIACENFLSILEEGYGLKWVALRLFATFGPGHKPNAHQGIVNVLLTQLLAGNQVIVKGSLKRLRDLIFVEDTAKAIITCLFHDKTNGQILNVGSGEATSILSLIETLCSLLGKSINDIRIIEDAKTVGDPLYNVANITKLKQTTAFIPRIPLKQGLDFLIQARTKKI